MIRATIEATKIFFLAVQAAQPVFVVILSIFGGIARTGQGGVEEDEFPEVKEIPMPVSAVTSHNQRRG
jgi:hypothetical protein